MLGPDPNAIKKENNEDDEPPPKKRSPPPEFVLGTPGLLWRNPLRPPTWQLAENQTSSESKKHPSDLTKEESARVEKSSDRAEEGEEQVLDEDARLQERRLHLTLVRIPRSPWWLRKHGRWIRRSEDRRERG